MHPSKQFKEPIPLRSCRARFPYFRFFKLFQYQYLFLSFCGSTYALSWEDPPYSGYEQILGYQMPEIESLVQKYHEIPKDETHSLLLRICALNEIAKRLEEHRDNAAAVLLQKQISEKALYLAALQNLPSEEQAAQYHTSCHPNALSLRNTISYSLKMREYWGAFWLESIDPCHRRLAHYYVRWKETHPVSSDYLSFFLWLETQYVPPSILTVKYLNENELAAFEAIIENGKLISKQSKVPLSTSTRAKWIYIITLDEQLYIAPWGNAIWHTSFSHGKPVLGSGLLTIENGALAGISFESGHYLPSIQQGHQSLQWFQSQGILIAQPLQITYFLNRTKYTISVSEKEYSDPSWLIHLLEHPDASATVSVNEF